MSTAEKLRAAKALIEDPGRWCEGMAAQRSDGQECLCRSKFAVKWCAAGACEKRNANLSIIERAAREMGAPDVVSLNDQSDHPTVMKMFDRAIELAEREEAS